MLEVSISIFSDWIKAAIVKMISLVNMPPHFLYSEFILS